MSAMPRFFFLAALAGAALWATQAPYPFILLAKLILAASALGLALSLLYVHEFLPWEWHDKIVALKRWLPFAH